VMLKGVAFHDCGTRLRIRGWVIAVVRYRLFHIEFGY